jgi:hypothetical protein
VYIVQLKRDGFWANAWATLNASTAQDVAAVIQRAVKGERASYIVPGFRREGPLLLFDNVTFDLGKVASATSVQRDANHISNLGDLLVGVGFLSMALHDFVETNIAPNSAFGWFELVLAGITVTFLFPAAAIYALTRIRDTATKVHLVQLSGTMGRSYACATVDQDEADAIVADINSAIAAGKVP